MKILLLPQPVITQWRSVRTHAGSPLSITLDALASGNGLTGPTVEPRNQGIQRIEVDFNDPVTLASASGVTVTGRTTTAAVMGGPIAYTPNSVVQNGSNGIALLFNAGTLPDQSCYQITISPSTITVPGPLGLVGDFDCNVRSLKGDTTMSGLLNLTDVIFTNLNLGAAVNAASAKHDVDLSGGVIDAADFLAVKAGVTSPAKQALCP
jgi:hypothetical protein